MAEETSSQIDIYKYRRISARNSVLINTPATETLKSPNIRYELDDNKKQKTYAILQETRSEFTNSGLRSVLLIYSNPAWKLFVLTILFVEYIIDTCLYTFCDGNERPFWAIMLCICFNFVFMFDFCVIVGLKFFKRWRKTLNIVEPDTTKVVLDIILAVPYAFLYLGYLHKISFDYQIIAPIMATIRVYKIIEHLFTRSSQAGSNQWTTFLSQYLIFFILSVHSWTCVWYLFSYRSFDIKKIRSSWSMATVYLPTEATFDWYFVCGYWSVMFLTTNALGDLYPVTTTERVTAILATLLGFLLTTVVFVGSLTSQFITITTRRSQYVRKLKEIQNHLSLIKMDTDTTKRIIRYYEDLWYQKSGVFKPKLLKLLPYPLQMEICYDLNAVPLYSSLIFRKLPEPFLRRLSLNMTHQFYLPGDVVYSHNQNKSIMVCITSGVLELLSDEDDESPMISFTKGTCFGEIALAYNVPARCTVKAATYVECQVLRKTKFIRLMVTYPDLVEDMRKEILERINKSKLRKHLQGSSTNLQLNIFASKDRKKSSIKCLKDKLRYIQGLSDEDTLTKEDHLEEDFLDLYILSEHVKKRTTPFTCMNSKFPWILESDCYLVKYWELYMLFITFYICIAYPYYIGIKRKFPAGFTFYAQVVVIISLLLNLLMSSVTAIKTKKSNIHDLWGILRYRMNTLGFYLDLIAVIPFEFIVTIHTTVKYHDNFRDHLYYLCKGVKLCLVWRLSNFFESLENKLLLNTIIVKVAKYCVYICLLSYWSGVILYMESCFVERCSENSWFSKALLWHERKPGVTFSRTRYPLVTSIYFAISILLSVGSGDHTPGDKYDMGFVAFLSLYGVLLAGYCISEFSAVVTHWSRTKTAFLEVIMTIDKFMQENNMHPAIKARIMAFYELQWQYNSGVELTEENWLTNSVVPLELRKKVLHQARFKALTSIRFFQVKNKAYIQTLTETARDIILPPGEIVYYGGTVTRELYIIVSGYVLVTSTELREKKQERVIGPGNHLGLLVLLYGVPAVSTVITLTHCKLTCVNHAAYNSALSLFPEMREHEGLMSPEELNLIERQAKSQNADAYLKYYNVLTKKKRVKITNFLAQFFDNSFINVIAEYNKRKMSYTNSFKNFSVLNNVSFYLLMPIVIKPDGIFLKVWAIVRVITAFLLCILVPIVVSMAPMCGAFDVILVALECICYVDLYLMMHVAFYGPKNQLIYHPYLTAKNFLKGPFIIDILTCFPWYALWKLVVPQHDEGHSAEDHAVNSHMFHCALKMINVLQIFKLYTTFWAESISALRRAYLMSVVHFFLLTLYFLNLYTSILIIITCRYVVAANLEEYTYKIDMLSLKGPYINTTFHPDGNMICLSGSWIDGANMLRDEYLPPTKVYLLAYYWSATSFSGAGFGDITAKDTTTMLLAICNSVHGVLFFGYVYARIASLKAVADQVVTKFQENLKHLDLFLSRENLPFHLKKTIMEYWKYQWKRTGGWSHQTILGKLHANLNEDAVLYMYEKTLREIPLFEDVEYSFFRAFAKKLKEQYYQKGYMVLRSNEVIDYMYIIYRGKVDIMSEINEVEACMGPGGIFGNIRGASKCLTMSNIVASRNLDVLSIPGHEFYALLKSYPTVLRKVKYSVGTTSKDYVLPTIASVRTSSDVDLFPLTYEPGDDDDDDDDDAKVSQVTESPEKSIASHGSRSITSVANVYFIPASLLIFKPHKWFRSSILPDSALVTVMEYLILFVAYMDFMLLVYQMAFQSVPYFLYICIVTDMIFLFKTFLDVHCAYMNRYGDYVLQPRKVRQMYFSKVYLRRRDFLANLPICYMAFTVSYLKPHIQLALFSFLRTPQLFRISYLFTYRFHSQSTIGSANLLIKLTSIGIWASIMSHVNACLFFKLSCLTPVQCTSANWMTKEQLNLRAHYSEDNYFALYIAALWYMVNLLTITGTGDVSSQNNFEVVETTVIIIVIKFCTGLLISEMSALISAHSSSRIAYDYQINELRDGLRDMDLSEHQMSKMWDYVRQLWSRQQGRQMPRFVHKLPFRLRCQVMQAVYGSHIQGSIIFSKTDDDFKRMLAMWMKHCVFFPGNYIVQCGDSDQCIYFIHRGQVEVLTVHPNLTESIYDVLGPEDSFGVAQGLFVGVAHHFSFRARTVVDTVYLKLDQWKYLLDYYPKSAKLVQRKVENVYLAM